jgi:hypothetical protein
VDSSHASLLDNKNLQSTPFFYCSVVLNKKSYKKRFGVGKRETNLDGVI